MRVFDAKGTPVDLVLACAEKGTYDGKPLPRTGSVCRISYRVWALPGVLYESFSRSSPPDAPIAVVEKLACEPPPVLRDAVILEYGPEPPGSGLLAFYRGLKVRTEAGAVVDMVMLWAGDGRYFSDDGVLPPPAVGSVCAITYTTEPLMDWVDEQHRPMIRNIVKSTDCRPPA